MTAPPRPRIARRLVPSLDTKLVSRIASRPCGGDPGLEVERVAGMLLDRQAVAGRCQRDRRAVDRDQEPLGVQRARHLAVEGQPLRTLGPGPRADERAEVLRQRQLGQADLVVDLQPARRERDLDRSIHPLVGDVVRAGRQAAQDREGQPGGAAGQRRTGDETTRFRPREVSCSTSRSPCARRRSPRACSPAWPARRTRARTAPGASGCHPDRP